MTKIIEFDNVSFAYAASDTSALEDVSFHIENGTINIIIGTSGSGKTTLLRLMKERTAPVGRLCGTIQVSSQYVGMVSQEPESQLVMDTVWHELAFGLENMGVDNASIRKRVAEMAEYMDMTAWFEKSVDELSGGEKQLLNLASVMCMQPEALLLDEPTAQLDPPAARKFIQTVAELNRDLGVTIVLVEHNLEDILELADKVIALENGRVIFDGEPRKAAEYLISTASKLELALPSAARIPGYLGHLYDNCVPRYPLSVREGREYLRQVMSAYADSKLEKLHIGEDAVSTGTQNLDDGNESRENIGLLLNETDMAIIANDLEFTYKKGEPKVINRLDIEVKKGRVTALLGGNGAGKSTFLKLCAGVYKPTHGKLKVSGRVALLSQDVMSMFTEVSVEEELAEVLMDKRLPYATLSLSDKKAKVDDMIERLDLSECRSRHPYDCSGGQKQKLAIGKLLLMKPDILLLDEPTKGLDTFAKKEIGEWLRSEVTQGITVLIVTHDVDYAAEFADECGLLFNGDVLSLMETHEFFAGNMFFTTNVNRIMKDFYPKCVSMRDVAEVNVCR